MKLAMRLVPLALAFGLVAGGTVASPYTTGTNSDEPSRGQSLKKAPPGMLWIPEARF